MHKNGLKCSPKAVCAALSALSFVIVDRALLRYHYSSSQYIECMSHSDWYKWAYLYMFSAFEHTYFEYSSQYCRWMCWMLKAFELLMANTTMTWNKCFTMLMDLVCFASIAT